MAYLYECMCLRLLLILLRKFVPLQCVGEGKWILKNIYICNDLSNIQLNHSTILLSSLFFCINSRWILNPYWWFWKVQLTSYLCLLRFLISSHGRCSIFPNFWKGFPASHEWNYHVVVAERIHNTLKKYEQETGQTDNSDLYLGIFNFQIGFFNFYLGCFKLEFLTLIFFWSFVLRRRRGDLYQRRVDNKATIKIFKSQGFVSIVCFCMLF